VGGSFGGSDTSFTVAGGLVGDGELSEVPADHIELDLDIGEGLATVDADHVADHLGHDDSISEVSLDGDGLLSWYAVLFGFLAFSVQSDVLVLDFCLNNYLLLVKRLRILALNSSTTCSWVSSLSWSGVSPLKAYLLRPFSFFWIVAIVVKNILY